MNESNTHIYCPTCRWIGTWDQCEDRPSGKYKVETHKWCPKCGRSKTFHACPPPLQFPTRYPADLHELAALSIRQPWAWLVAGGVKGYENRVWGAANPGRKFRGSVTAESELALHLMRILPMGVLPSARSFDTWMAELARACPKQPRRGSKRPEGYVNGWTDGRTFELRRENLK